MKKKFPRGSERRKWDLHVHSPESDGYSGTWDQFKIQIQNAECDVIGINDYFSVAGYKKIIEEVKEGTFDIGGREIFPIVEMRMTDTVQNRNSQTNGVTHFNFHIIFNNELNTEDIENFIKSLKSGGTLISTDYNDKSKLKEKKVSFDETINILKNDVKFKDNFLIRLPYDEYGGIGEIDPNSDGWIKENFIKNSDILGSSNQKQIDFFLWKSEIKSDGTFKFSQEQFKVWFESKKACIKGSDSHSSNYPIGKLKDKDSNPIEKFCRIKADPTFEGLMQIVYEPEERVKLQEVKPEEKQDYQIIDSVKFVDNKNNFFSDEILINQNLTTIIGGKSTGKSILLREIARSIDGKEVEDRLKEVDIKDYEDKFGNKLVPDFRVIWKDQQESKKNEVGLDKKIIYIPQSYLNRLVDKKEDKTSIDDIIKNVLEQDVAIKNEFISLKENTRNIEEQITKDIETLFYTQNDINDLLESIKKIGDKKGIETEIEKMKSEIFDLKKKSGISDDELNKYDILMKNASTLKEKGIILKKDLEILALLKDQSIIKDISLYELSEVLQKDIGLVISQIKLKYEKEWKSELNEKIKKLEDELIINESDTKKNNINLSPLATKVLESKALDEKIKKMDIEEQKLKLIVREENKLLILKKTYDDLILSIIEKHSKFYEIMFNAKSKILKQKIIVNELEFNMGIVFENKNFQENFINDVCNLKFLGQFEGGFLTKYNRVDNADFKVDIGKIIQGILLERLILKGGYTKKEAITRLTKNWFIFDYKIRQNGDEISEMSPGKKSFVLLQLLIELDRSQCPILLDQPEDDLDNRSIYNDLVRFIKEKKKVRQIILATHNPNLVVGADSECIIVANQNGDKAKNKTYKFEYIEGALENSFRNEEEEILYKQGIQEHVCDILEGGQTAFEKRKNKYHFTK